MIGITADSLLEKHGNGRYAKSLIKELLDHEDLDWCLIPYSNRGVPDNYRNLVKRFLPQKKLVRMLNLFTNIKISYNLQAVKLLHVLRPSEVLNLNADIPQIVTIHDTGSPFSNKHLRFINNQSVRLMRRNAAKIVSSSETTRQELIKNWAVNPEQIITVFPGIDEQFFSPITEETVAQVLGSLSITTPYIIASGYIAPHKNIQRFIDAYWLLCEDDTTTPSLVIVGSDANILRDEYKEHPFSHKLINLGYVQNNMFLPLIHAAELLVYPSLFEGFGFPPLEAQALGTPVAASNIPVLKETLANTAFFFDPYSVEDIANVTKNALASEEKRNAVAELGRENVSRFNWKNVVRQYIKIYYEFLP